MNIQLIIYASVFFFISEMLLLVLKRSKNKIQKSENDKKSLLYIWVSIAFSMTFGFFLANFQQWDSSNKTIATIGLLIFILGTVIRWVSIWQLKKEFTVDVAIQNDHQLKTDGFYSYVRHPSYSGLLLICLGLSIAMNSLLSVLGILPVVFAVLYRIKVEEAVLIQEFGKTYREFKQKTYKLIPKIF